ncbi:MAG: heparinase II/III family protein [Sedimentisphaerales bacterium]|nr:heparinase II/III family protein [Sedimentisphaerales bacterium]
MHLMRIFASVVLLELSVSIVAGQGEPVFMPIPINVAEAIIEPFWAPGLSGFDQWTVSPGDDWGLHIQQNWDAVAFEWASKPTRGPALRMVRDFNVDCSNYDRLLVRLTTPKQSTFKITAFTDVGERVYTSVPELQNATEHSLDLCGAKLIKRLVFEIEANAEGSGAGWFHWIGLQNTDRMNRYTALWDYSRIRWVKHIKPVDQITKFEPRYGIFLNTDELAELRKQHQRAVKEHGQSRYSQEAAAAHHLHPEKGIHEFVNSGGQSRGHGRVRDQFQARLEGDPDIAIAGLVVRDAEALRVAARYALSLAMSGHWDTGFMSHLPAGPWEDRAFRRSYTAQDIAMILDLAGEAFTETGRQFLMRRLAEEGVGPINYVAWRHEYIFHCNQLAYFNTGRMYAYLVLEREWPRVKPYTDLAYRDAVNNLEHVIQPDGGTLEGPGYFNPIVRENYKAIKYYARSRNLTISELIPDVLKSTVNYAMTVASITADDAIPICDSDSSLNRDTLEILSELMPDSYWTTMYNKLLVREGEPPSAQTGPPLPAFISLPDTGYIASARSLNGQQVKLFIMGHQAGADHTHEDKGSFVLEFAGQAFALDLGICDYDNPIHAVYKHCQRHNMLVPVGMPERAHPQRPLPVEVKPVGHGDEKSFHARIDATPGWDRYYRKWIRSWDSPSPETWVIRDDYILARGNAVEFYWQTKLPVQQRGRTVVIEGQQGRATLEVPADCTIRIDRLPLADGQKHNRIAVRKNGSQGVLEVTVRLRTDPVVE